MKLRKANKLANNEKSLNYNKIADKVMFNFMLNKVMSIH